MRSVDFCFFRDVSSQSIRHIAQPKWVATHKAQEPNQFQLCRPSPPRSAVWWEIHWGRVGQDTWVSAQACRFTSCRHLVSCQCSFKCFWFHGRGHIWFKSYSVYKQWWKSNQVHLFKNYTSHVLDVYKLLGKRNFTSKLLTLFHWNWS